MNLEPKPILILGTGSFAVEIADLVSEIPGAVVAGFVENMDRNRCTALLDGRPVYWVDELARIFLEKSCNGVLGPLSIG